MTLSADTYLYVSMAPEQKIQIFRMNEKDGKLTPVDSIAVDGSPGCLVLDPEKKHLFATLRSTSLLASYSVDSATGKLKTINSVPLVKGENAAYVNTDRTGRWLFSASYAAGKITVHAIGEDGSLKTPAVQTIETAKTAHCVGVHSDNRWVFVPHVAPNAVYQFHLDVKTGKLADAGKAPGGPNMAGPRHIAFHPSMKTVYTSDEMANTTTAYDFDPEKGLKATQSLSTLPADFKDKNTTAEVKVHPSGKFVWVSNRGHDSLAGFAFDGKELKPLGQMKTEPTPRSFDIDPSGQFLFCGGEGSGKLAAYRIDTATGKLTKTDSYEIGKSLTWVLAVKLGK